MPEQGRDRVAPDATEALPESTTSRSLCIVSGEPLRPGTIAALHAAVNANDELTIVVDRRRGGSGSTTSRTVDRRSRPPIDAKVKTDGFAIVPVSTDDARETDPPWIERLSADQDADGDAGERAIRNILEFKRRRKGRIGPLLGLAAFVGVFVGVLVLVVALSQVTGVRTSAERTSAPPDAVQAPPVVETIPPPPRGSVSPPIDNRPPKRSEPTSPRTERARKPPSGVAAPPLPAPPREVLPAPQAPLAASTPPPRQPTSTPPEAGSPLASAEPARPPEATPPQAHAGATPADSPAPTSSAPSRPIGIHTFIKDQVSRDASAAGADAKRQIDDLKGQATRVWNNARRVFGDSSR